MFLQPWHIYSPCGPCPGSSPGLRYERSFFVAVILRVWAGAPMLVQWLCHWQSCAGVWAFAGSWGAIGAVPSSALEEWVLCCRVCSVLWHAQCIAKGANCCRITQIVTTFFTRSKLLITCEVQVVLLWYTSSMNGHHPIASLSFGNKSGAQGFHWLMNTHSSSLFFTTPIIKDMISFTNHTPWCLHRCYYMQCAYPSITILGNSNYKVA